MKNHEGQQYVQQNNIERYFSWICKNLIIGRSQDVHNSNKII